VWTILLVGGFIWPWVLAAAWATGFAPLGARDLGLLGGSVIASIASSMFCAMRFRQDWSSGLLRPVGIAMLIAIQWYALVSKLVGAGPSWKGRVYPSAG
jgi:hypothetical protein